MRKPTAPTTSARAAARSAAEAAAGAARKLVLAVGLGVLIVAGVLFVDIPLYALDGAARSDALAPSRWLRLGDVFLISSVYAVLLLARRHGAETATQIILVAWVAAAGAVGAELAYLAPQLEPGDLPSVRFAVAFAGSWIAGQIVAAHMFDLARSTDWWRAPLYGALWGFCAQSAIFMIGQFAGLVDPWPNWLMTDLFVKCAVAVAFLPIYAALRKSVRPRPGYGGR